MNLKKADFLVHPILFGIYPVLFLYSYNIDQVRFSEILMPLVLTVSSAVVLLLLLAFVFKNKQKAGIIVSVFLILFFTFGHVWGVIKDIDFVKKIDNVEYYLLIIWILLFIACVIITVRTGGGLRIASGVLNTIAVSLIMISIVTIGFHEIKAIRTNKSPMNRTSDEPPASQENPEELPDIYYIILDGYAHHSTLKTIYNYSNDEFLDYLTGRGFFVASESTSNYPITFLSLASSLNLEYINYLSGKIGKESKNIRLPVKMILDNKVTRFLKSKGYTFIHFRSGTAATDFNEYADIDIDCGKLNEFKILLMKTTIICLFYRELDFIELSRKRVLNTFLALKRLPKMKDPTFTFAHIISPHPPYLFDRDGRPVPKAELSFEGDIWEAKEHYINQLVFINKKIKELVNDLLIRSKNPPVIVLQADHGSASLFGGITHIRDCLPSDRALRERFRILNVYYLPRNGKALLYDSITPVNTFRLIFNYYFNASYELLDDRNYYSSYIQPYNFFDVSEKVWF